MADVVSEPGLLINNLTPSHCNSIVTPLCWQSLTFDRSPWRHSETRGLITGRKLSQCCHWSYLRNHILIDDGDNLLLRSSFYHLQHFLPHFLWNLLRGFSNDRTFCPNTPGMELLRQFWQLGSWDRVRDGRAFWQPSDWREHDTRYSCCHRFQWPKVPAQI